MPKVPMMTSIEKLAGEALSFGQRLQNNAASAWGKLYSEMGIAGKVNKASQEEIKNIVKANLTADANVEMEQVLKEARQGLRQSRYEAFARTGQDWGISGSLDDVIKVFDRYDLGSGSIESFNAKSKYAFKELGGTEKNYKEAILKKSQIEDRAIAKAKGIEAEELNDTLDSVTSDYRNNKISASGTYASEYKAAQNAQAEALKIEQETPKFIGSTTYDTQGGLFTDDNLGVLTSDPEKIPMQAAEHDLKTKGMKTVTKDVEIKSPDGVTSRPIEVFQGTDATIPGEGTLLYGNQLRAGNVPKSRITSNEDLASNGLKKPGSLEYQKALKEKLLNKYGNNLSYDPEKVRLDAALKKMEEKSVVAPKPPIKDGTPWANGMKIALGTAVTGAALCAALSASRGQQNNAQLYGQQPLY